MNVRDLEPEGEAQRLAALETYAVLDTPAEPGFDDIVRIASQICGTPMALISLIDDRRQWFKAALGVDLSETPREIAFCASAIEQTGLFAVPDTAADPRFADNPLVTGEPGLRFYAGAPLVTPEGHALGTLCVLDRQPRQLSTDQADALAALARQVMVQLELRRAVQRQAADERHRRMLVEELRHRSRNTLAVVQSIIMQSLRGIEGTADARRAISDRLVAMADAHDLLSRADWQAAPIGAVVATAIHAVAGTGTRVTWVGPEIELNARAALALSMALHELATNALKYGALSSDAGTVSMHWTVAPGDAALFQLVWQEAGGPVVQEPQRRGFGSQLITAILPRELGGSAALAYPPEGVRWTLDSTLGRLGIGLPD